MRVSKSEYCDYVKRRKSNAQIEREALEGFVAERFDLHKGRYGYRRINRELRRDGIVVSERRVLAVMRKLGLQDEGGGEAGRVQIHRALLQQAEDALIDRLQRPVRPRARRCLKKLIFPSKKP